MSEDFFGKCHKCDEDVIGEGKGCSAMGNVYHVKCFTCAVCAQPLRGKQFYAIDVSLNDSDSISDKYLDEYLNQLTLYHIMITNNEKKFPGETLL